MNIVEEWNERELLFWKEQLDWTEWFNHTLDKRQQILWHYDTQKYCKIPKISPRPGLIFCKDPFRGAYFCRGLSMEGNLRFQIDWASLIDRSKFTVFALFYFVFGGNVPSTSPRGGLYLDRWFNGGVFALSVWGAYIWRSLYMCKKREKMLYLLELTVIKQLHWRKINARQQFIECSFPIFSHFILLLKVLVIVRNI